MNVPLSLSEETTRHGAAPLRIRAHLLHQLRTTLSPVALRAAVPGMAVPLPRRYWQQALGSPLQDFLGRGSKMFRASMVEWAWNATGGDGDLPACFPLAVEALHAGSLIIDDIEDQATERRGDEALHLRYGVAPALNAGNWLYFWPSQLISEAKLPPDQELAALKKLSETQYRCHLGQGLDVALKIQDIEQADVYDITATKTALKTGTLMGLSAYLGALAAGSPPEHRDRLARFGEQLGNVLQMLDDAGSILSDTRHAKACEDLVAGGPTWPWSWAAQELDGTEFRNLVDLSHDVQTGVIDYGVLRDRLRDCIPEDLNERLDEQLREALESVRPVVVSPRSITAMEKEFRRLRNSYV